jgi:lipopolysaccharide heptosyltransferase I
MGKKVLVLRLSAGGDVIRTLPAVRALKEHAPDDYVAWVVEEPSRLFLKSQPEVDEVILFPRKRWSKGIRSTQEVWRTLREIYQFILALRRQRFDIALDFHGILKSGLLSLFSGAPKRIGFDRKSSKEGNFLFSNIKVRLPRERISRHQKNVFLLAGIGLKVKSLDSDLHISPADREAVESFFRSLSVSITCPLIAIHPGTSPKTLHKRWMPDRYSQLADRFIRDLGASVIFTWGPDELDWVEGIREAMKEPSILGPRTESLTQLGEVLRRCNLYVGGDTGPMHVASSVGIPVVAIFGPTDPIENEPLGEHKKVLKEVGCNPCRKRSCRELTCLKAVTVDDVFRAAKEALPVNSWE